MVGSIWKTASGIIIALVSFFVHSGIFISQPFWPLLNASFLRQDWDKCHLGITKYTRWRHKWVRMTLGTRVRPSARCLRSGWPGSSPVGLGSQSGRVYSGHTLTGHRWGNDKNLLSCRCWQKGLFCWRCEVSEDFWQDLDQRWCGGGLVLGTQGACALWRWRGRMLLVTQEAGRLQ